MDSYLQIARDVLKRSRQPLSARQILEAARQLQLVPRDLFGRTQHKTLQARLATDILKRRSSSEFYRTGPGLFFLRIFQSDPAIPRRYRREYNAPLRAAQLGKFDVVAFPRAALLALETKLGCRFDASELFALPWRFMRLYNLRKEGKLVPFRFQLLLISDGRVLLDHRKPSPADGDLHAKSSVGIEGYVKRGDLSLFSPDAIGLIDAGVRTLFEQLALPPHVISKLEEGSRWGAPMAVLLNSADNAGKDLFVYLRFECAGLDEVISAINRRVTAEWLSVPLKLNDLDRFDRSSAHLISNLDLQRQLCC